MKNFKELRENQVLSEMAVSRKDFDKIKKNDVIEFVFDSSMKKGHKVKLKVKSKTRSNKYNVDKINMVDATDPRNKTKFTLFSRGGKDATLGWGGMGVVIKSYKIGVKEEVNEDGQYVSPNNMTDKQKQDLKDKQQRERERRIRQMKIGQQDSKDEIERKKKERERRLRQYGGKTEAVSPAQQAAIAISKKEKEQKECKDEKDFKPHMMYDPKTGKGVKANTYADHLKYDKMGYTHEPVKEQNCGCGKTPCETYGRKDEAMNPKDKAKRLAMIKKAVERINARNAEKAKKDALKMMKDSGMFEESVDLSEVTDQEINAVKKLSKDIQKVKTDYFKIAKMGDKTLKMTKFNKRYESILKAQQDVLKLIGDLSNLKMMQKESTDLTEKKSHIDQIRDIVKTKGAKKVGGVMVDMFTASAIVKVYDAINDTNKAKMDKMTVPAMANVAYKIINKNKR